MLLRFSVDFQIFRKLFENSPRIFAHEFYQNHFPESYNFLMFSENFKTNFGQRAFSVLLAAESIRQDGAILSDDQPIKLLEGRAGCVRI